MPPKSGNVAGEVASVPEELTGQPRRVVLGGAGLPSFALDKMGLTLFDNVLPIVVEAAILLGFGVVMLAIAVRNFRVRD